MSEPQGHVPAKREGPCPIRRVFEHLQWRRVPFAVEYEFAGNGESQLKLLTRPILRRSQTNRRLEADRDRHVRPRLVRLALEPPEVDARDGERAVVQEAADRLDRRTGIAPQLGGSVAEDVQTGRRETRGPEVPPEAAVERRARDAASARARPARATRSGPSRRATARRQPAWRRAPRRPVAAARVDRACRPFRGTSRRRCRPRSLMSPAVRPMTSARRRPVRTKMSSSARSRRPATVSGTTASSRRTSSALRPRATDGTVFGRSSASHGLTLVTFIRIRNR